MRKFYNDADLIHEVGDRRVQRALRTLVVHLRRQRGRDARLALRERGQTRVSGRRCRQCDAAWRGHVRCELSVFV